MTAPFVVPTRDWRFSGVGPCSAFHEPEAGRMSSGRLEDTNNTLQVLRRVAPGTNQPPRKPAASSPRGMARSFEQGPTGVTP
jgi:hypothetical protein